MTMAINQEEIDALHSQLKGWIESFGIKGETELICKDWDEWSLLLYFKIGNNRTKDIEDAVEATLRTLGVDDERICYLGDKNGSLIWYFSHPNTPKEILEKQDREIEEEELREEQESKRRYEEHRRKIMQEGVIIRPHNTKSNNPELFYIMDRENFREIEIGYKEEEFRTYNQYHVDKCLGKGKDGIKTLVFQNGYGGKGHEYPRKIRFECDGIYLCDDTMEEVQAFNDDGTLKEEDDLPEGFIPMYLAIHIGKRIG